MNEQTVYEQIGDATIKRLVDRFYALVEQDPQLRPLFPVNLEPGKQGQYLFLVQYFGGPDTYSQERGHPRLRMRHAPFAIGKQQRDLWVGHMLTALNELNLPEPARSTMEEYFRRSATFMINQTEPGQTDLRIVPRS